MNTERKPGKTTVDITPSTGYIVVEAPIIAKKTSAGLHKTDAMIQKEAETLPKFIKVVGIGPDVYDIEVGDYVGLDQAQGPKYKDGERAFMVIHSSSVVAIATGKMREEAEKAYNVYMENRKADWENKASNIIIGASN